MVILQALAVSNSKISPTPSPSYAPSEVPGYGISQSNSYMELIGLVFILVLILVAAYYVSKYIGRLSLGQLKNSNFTVIDTYRISPNKFIQIVKVANKYIVLSVAKDTVNFITELDEAEVFVKEVHTNENMNFKQILEKIRNKTEK